MKTLLALALALAAVVSNAAIYDFAADFSVTNGNPNGAWSYGYRASLLSDRTAMTLTGSTASFMEWKATTSGDGNPSIFKRLSGNANGVAAGQAGLHSGPNGEWASLLFTAPESGNLTLQSIFGAGDGGDVDLQVRLNGVPVYNALDVTDERTFDLTTPVAVTAGQTLEVLVGPSGSYAFDSTPVSARIDIAAVPEPATMAILGIGALGLLRRARRRHA